jgi:Ca2+-binding RTX toxin-like protein
MRTRALSVGGFFLLLLTLAAMPAQRVNAEDLAPTCYDQRTQQHLVATRWLTAPGTLVGTNKRDVLVGSTGVDTIKGLGGNDVICTIPDGETELGVDVVDSGAGDDYVNGIAIANGGTGNDYLVLHWTESKGYGGPGSDTILFNGGLGDGGSGNDLVVGYSSQVVLGGSGKDKVANFHGTVQMDCGSGSDSYVADAGSDVGRCENDADPCAFPNFNGTFPRC